MNIKRAVSNEIIRGGWFITSRFSAAFLMLKMVAEEMNMRQKDVREELHAIQSLLEAGRITEEEADEMKDYFRELAAS